MSTIGTSAVPVVNAAIAADRAKKISATAIEQPPVEEAAAKIPQEVWNNVTDEGQPIQPAVIKQAPPTPLYDKGVAVLCIGAGAWAATNIAMHVASLPAASAALAAVGVAGVAAVSWLAADAGSGVFHFGVDNYGSPKTPVVGKMIKEFQEHHIHPWDLQEVSIPSNVVHTGQILGPALLAIAALNPNYLVQTAALAAVTGGVMTQVSHRWAHQGTQAPVFAKVMQKLGVFQPSEDHSKHHNQPVERYCIVNGFWNETFQKMNLWRRLEYGIYKVTGAEPNSWFDPGIKAKALGQISEKDFLTHQKENRRTFWKALITKLKTWDPDSETNAKPAA